MTDDLDKLKALLDQVTPAPDQTRKAENIALAQKNFADLQGSTDEARPIHNRPLAGLWKGTKSMLNTLTSRAGLTASTALVAVGLFVAVPMDQLRRNETAGPVADLVSQDTPIATPEDIEVSPPTPEAPSVQKSATSAEVAPVELPNFTLRPQAAAREEVETSDADQGTIIQGLTSEVAVDGFADSAELLPAPSARANNAALSGELMSITDSMVVDEAMPQPSTETYANEPSSPLKITDEDPVSTFSIDVDTASYSIVRNSIMRGQLPPTDAVRIEELVNYFTYDYPAPARGEAFRPSVRVSQTPWNSGTRLVEIGIQGELPATDSRPPLNLVFLIDTSGSMEGPTKLPLLKQSFRLMLSQLRPEDQVAIVTYAGSAGEVLAPTKAAERSTILNALDRLGAGGSTAGQAGLAQAYATAERMSEDGEISRVILATDGDFNVGIHDPEALKNYIADKRESGTYLSVLGFGRGNLDDATMQALAQNGNGQAAYIDTLQEAQKVLVDQLAGALFPIANDVKIQVEFNPAEVAEYRLIGYETRALRREDFNNDKVDAGDIGAGHQVTALYEITPVGSSARLTEPLRYGEQNEAPNSGELGFLRLRYKAPGEAKSKLIEAPISANEIAPAGFASAIAGFGQLLRNGSYIGDWSFDDAIKLAQSDKGADHFGYRAEAIRLMQLAKSLSN